MKATMKEAFRELFMWQSWHREQKNPDWFTAKLYDLIGKADHQNKEALRKGFPNEVGAWELWEQSRDPAGLFKEWAEKE